MIANDESSTNAAASKTKIAVFGLVIAAVAAGYFYAGDVLTLENLAANEADLRSYRQEHPVLVYGIAFTIYVVVTGLSLPGAAVLTLAYGWYFGLIRGVLLVSFASTIGATLAFLLSRYLLRDSIESRFGDRLEAFNDNLRREGAFYLFTLRMIPAVPFFVINLVMGLTPMRATTFLWVSQIGMLAGTIAFVYAGSSVPDLATLQEQGLSSVLTLRTLLAFAVLGTLPLLTKIVVNRFRPRQIESVQTIDP